MFAKSYDKAGTFVVEVHGQIDNLSAGHVIDADSGKTYAVKWLPCSQCLELHKVKTSIVSFFCNDECRQRFEEEHPSQHSETPGYSRAAGIFN